MLPQSGTRASAGSVQAVVGTRRLDLMMSAHYSVTDQWVESVTYHTSVASQKKSPLRSLNGIFCHLKEQNGVCSAGGGMVAPSGHSQNACKGHCHRTFKNPAQHSEMEFLLDIGIPFVLCVLLNYFPHNALKCCSYSRLVKHSALFIH